MTRFPASDPGRMRFIELGCPLAPKARYSTLPRLVGVLAGGRCFEQLLRHRVLAVVQRDHRGQGRDHPREPERDGVRICRQRM